MCLIDRFARLAAQKVPCQVTKYRQLSRSSTSQARYVMAITTAAFRSSRGVGGDHFAGELVTVAVHSHPQGGRQVYSCRTCRCLLYKICDARGVESAHRLSVTLLAIAMSAHARSLLRRVRIYKSLTVSSSRNSKVVGDIR